MAFNNVLVVHKKSAYKIYFLEKGSSLYGKQRSIPPAELARFRAAHSTHYRTLDYVLQMLRAMKVRHSIHCRGRTINAAPYNLIVTVGGDGTFLESARSAVRQVLLGVNSDPERSIGRFCVSRDETFVEILHKVLSGRAVVQEIPRIRLILGTGRRKVNLNVLNDILVCHANPAAMSRYYLTIDGYREEHRSSGVWIATAAGSSGAVRSAGGKILPKESRKIQYRPRELYEQFNPRYVLRGGVLNLHRPVVVESLMRSGEIYVDGAHFKFPLAFGDKVRMTHSPQPARVVCG